MPSQRKQNHPPLLQTLRNNLLKARRIAVIGVGSELRGDDIAGVSVAEAILKSRKCPSNLKAFLGCTAPENLTGEIIRFLSRAKGESAHIILVDAAQMDLKPGHAMILESDAIAGTSFSTHVLPLAILVAYFKKQINCGVTVIGIQPKNTSFGRKPSAPITRAVVQVSSVILEAVNTPHGKSAKSPLPGQD